jgi:hypothetical protein
MPGGQRLMLNKPKEAAETIAPTRVHRTTDTGTMIAA